MMLIQKIIKNILHNITSKLAIGQNINEVSSANTCCKIPQIKKFTINTRGKRKIFEIVLKNKFIN